MMKKALIFLCLFASTQVVANECVDVYNEIYDKTKIAKSLYLDAQEYLSDEQFKKAARSASRSAELSWEANYQFQMREEHVYCYDESTLTEAQLQRDIRRTKRNERAAKCLRDQARAYERSSFSRADLAAMPGVERKEKLDAAIKAFSTAKRYCSEETQDLLDEQVAVLEKLKAAKVAKPKPKPAPLKRDAQPQGEAIDYSLFKIEKAFVKSSPQMGNRVETVSSDCHLRLVSRSDGRDNVVEINLSGAGNNLSFGDLNKGDRELQLSLSPARVNLKNYKVYIKYDNGEVLMLGGGKGRYWGLPVSQPVKLRDALNNLSAACQGV